MTISPSSHSFLLVHSPLVGPTTWRPTADVLRARGHDVAVPSLTHVLDGPGPYFPGIAGAVADAVADSREPVVLVGHSGAGPVLPAVAAALPVPVTAAVLVDAGLPHPGQTWFETAPPVVADQVRDLTRDGMLPPWHEWFPPEVVTELVPDQVMRDALVDELRPLPPAFFEEVAPAAPDLPPDRCGYLLLSDAYADVAAAAAALDWPVVGHLSDHLAVYTDPEPVAEALLTLVVGSSRPEPKSG